MKRQRNHDSDSNNVSFDDVMKFLRHNDDLSCDQLTLLTQEIQPLYANKFNLLSQTFPTELWQKIFVMVPIQDDSPYAFLLRTPKEETKFSFWLACRTVSKAWCSSISKIDFSPRHMTTLMGNWGMNISRLLSIFKFSQLTFERGACVDDITLLKNCTQLRFRADAGPPPPNAEMGSKLTQLTHLHFNKDFFPEKSLLCLTNLQDLAILECAQITTVSTLTNLISLWITNSPITQESTKMLTKLEYLTCDDPNFFRSGNGRRQPPGGDSDWIYDGSWLNGTRQGEGMCTWQHDPIYGTARYFGEWDNDEPHGKGKLDFWNYDDSDWHPAYEGDFFHGNRTGKGKREYFIGDTYEGDWVNGVRHGHGTYKFTAAGIVYDGEWQDGVIQGVGRCVYANGDAYDGEWFESERAGAGVYSCTNGRKIDGDFPMTPAVEATLQDAVLEPYDTEDDELPSDDV